VSSISALIPNVNLSPIGINALSNLPAIIVLAYMWHPISLPMKKDFSLSELLDNGSQEVTSLLLPCRNYWQFITPHADLVAPWVAGIVERIIIAFNNNPRDEDLGNTETRERGR
jgi:hypothetical protein